MPKTFLLFRVIFQIFGELLAGRTRFVILAEVAKRKHLGDIYAPGILTVLTFETDASVAGKLTHVKVSAVLAVLLKASVTWHFILSEIEIFLCFYPGR